MVWFRENLEFFFFRNFPGKRASVNSNKNKPARAENVRNHVAFLILHLIG